MESCNWRDQPERQRIVNKLMDTLKRHLPFSRHDILHQLKKIAERVEEEIYSAATTQSEYSRKICYMMLTMEARLQLPKQSNSAGLYNSANPSVKLVSTAGIGNPNGGDWQEEVYQKIKAMKELFLLDLTAQNANGGDWQEEVYQKIKAMKDLYLLDLNNLHQKVLFKLQQHYSLPQQPKNEQLEKLKVFKNMLERFMLFLQIPKQGILASYKDKLGSYEKQIIHIINSNRRKPMPPQQQALLPPHVQSLQQSQQTHSQSHDQMNLQGPIVQMLQSDKMPIQQQNQQSSASFFPTQAQLSQPQLQQQMYMQQRLPTTSGFQQQNVINQQKQLYPQQSTMPVASSSRALTVNPNGGDWQEEVYQEIKAMKDLYLLDLNDMHQKILSKLQQHDSLPQQPKNEQLEKLKVFKNMLERFMQFLQIPKQGILASYKDKLGTYEKQIINVINTNRRKPAPPQQQAQALPPQHMQSLQQSQQTHSRMTPVQSNDQMNLQGSMSSMQPNNMMCNLEQTNVFLSVGSNAQRLSTTGGLQLQNVIHQQKHLFQQQSAMPSASSTSLGPVAQTDNPNGGGWQEEIYQEIKAENDMYLLDSMPTQGVSGTIGDPTMEYGDWRAQMHADSRQRIVNKIMDILKRHLPVSGHEGLHALMNIAVRFEERIFYAAKSESDYLRKISLKMLSMETRSPNPMVQTPQI